MKNFVLAFLTRDRNPLPVSYWSAAAALTWSYLKGSKEELDRIYIIFYYEIRW